MMKLKFLVVLSALAMFAMGCAAAHSPVTGFLYTDVKGPINAQAGSGTKTGEACVTSILGWVATGDASINAAKKAGGISDVTAVDHSSTSILGLYAKFCTQVTGK